MGIRANNMTRHHHLLVAAVGMLLIGGALFFGNLSRATSDAYVFTARGDVIQVDRANNTLKVYSRHTLAVAADDLSGKVIEFNITGAKVFGYDAKGKKIRLTVGGLDVGDEVVLRGAKRKADHFNVSTITRNDNVVTVKGTLHTHDKSNRILTIDLTSLTKKSDGKAYRADTFTKGKRVQVYYASSTKIKNKSGAQINADELPGNSEPIEVRGAIVKYGSRFEVKSDAVVIDG